MIERVDPAGSRRWRTLLERRVSLYGRMPVNVGADGVFASHDNLEFAKSHQVHDEVFTKRRGVSVLDTARSAWMCRVLRNFQAGIEAWVSTLKKAFGLDSGPWFGWEGLKRYAGAVLCPTIF